jgi:UDP-N-acetylmuramate dehydrogenase
MRSEALLKAIPDVELRWREPLSKHITFRVGGPVRCLARPRTEEALAGLIRMLRKEQVRFLVLGGGSNVLPPDGEWDIVVIQLGLACHGLFRCRERDSEAECIYAGAGIRLS